MLRRGNTVQNLLAGAFILLGAGSVAAQSLVSKPDEYKGYSPAIYDGYKLTSEYVAVRDGTRLAIDVVRPTLNGVVVDKQLPVLWTNTPYNRRPSGPMSAQQYDLVKYGYVVAIADMRGNGASFGRAVATNRNEWMPWAYMDAYDITEWLAAQPWSDGKIGMLGCSAVGHSQWQAAATAPPHLTAIFPMSAPSEYYDWNGVTLMQDTTTAAPASSASKSNAIPSDKSAPMQPIVGAVPSWAKPVPVDGDTDGKLLKAALEEQRGNLEPGYIPFRDSPSPDLQARLGWNNFKYWLEANTLTHFDDINKAHIPAYETANFGEDMRVKLGVMVKLHNVKSPMKLVFAPGNHCNWSTEGRRMDANPFNITSEQLRWYDYWLKGIQNGIMDEPPIYLYTYNEPQDKSWKFSWQWPLPTAQDTKYYFGPQAPEGPVSGANNGTLSTKAPAAAGAKDQYTVDYSVTTETQNEKGMTYTTAPLAADTTLIGDPVIHLWIASTATDGDFIAYVADVAPDGKTAVLPGTDDGRVRASLRALNTPPYDNLGLPYHRSFAADVNPLTPGQPTELVFDLAPISYVFKAGHRVRLIIACVAAPHHKNDPSPTPKVTPPPVVSFYRDTTHASYVTLPVNSSITASVRIVSGKTATMAYLTFPKTVDNRYLTDVKTSSVKCNGVAATTTKVDGDTLVAEFASSKLKAGEAVTIQGEFGNKYYYGDFATFTSKGVVPRK